MTDNEPHGDYDWFARYEQGVITLLVVIILIVLGLIGGAIWMLS